MAKGWCFAATRLTRIADYFYRHEMTLLPCEGEDLLLMLLRLSVTVKCLHRVFGYFEVSQLARNANWRTKVVDRVAPKYNKYVRRKV